MQERPGPKGSDHSRRPIPGIHGSEQQQAAGEYNEGGGGGSIERRDNTNGVGTEGKPVNHFRMETVQIFKLCTFHSNYRILNHCYGDWAIIVYEYERNRIFINRY
jgi:hypothetical protein